MLHNRRSALLAGFAGFVAALILLLPNLANAQKIFPPGAKLPPTKGGSSEGYSSIRIIENGDFRRVINVGRDCIKDRDWKQAVKALQSVLEKKEDYYVKITDTDVTGKENSRWTSVKFEANNLIGSMEEPGLDEYEYTYGKEAKDLLDEAKAKGDRMMLADVAQRYCHTKAGIQANEILATLYLARGQVFTAALKFEKVLAMNPERAKLGDVTLFKAALAFRRAGEMKNYEETWARLEAKLQGKPLAVGDDRIPIAKLKAVLEETSFVGTANVMDWLRIRGNERNNAQALGSPPLLDSIVFSRKIFMDKTEGLNDEDADQVAHQRVQTAIKQVADANQPVLPGTFPIVSQGVMVYRSQRDIRAVALKEFTFKEDGVVSIVKKGEILWKTLDLDRSLSVLLQHNKTRTKCEQWLDTYNQVPGFNSFLFDNSLLGTLSTDQRLVYAINDLAVPPHPQIFTQFAFNNPAMLPQEIKPLMMSNELHAYDLMNGKRIWDINHEMKDFKDSHFLSQPISVGGKLYVLNEKLDLTNTGGGGMVFPGGGTNQFGGESELRLVCIDPNKDKVNADGKPEIVAIQVLGNVLQHSRFLQDTARRVNAVHLGFGEGILVCPTNAGEVFGIDLMTRSIVWSYPYRESQPDQIQLPGMPNINPGLIRPGLRNQGTGSISKWHTSPPALQDGKVVFTAPDADSVHCINLRDGRPVWKRAQADGDQYMAGVFNGKVLIVGKTNIRALNLKDGSQMWSIYTGDLPSGQGVASKGIYYLPLKKGEILAVDIDRGQIKAHNRAANQNTSPGNLVFYEGMVLSQTPNEVIAYPQLVARLASAKQESADDPENLAKLTDYGELLLKDGQVHLAVATLLKVFDKKPAGALSVRVNERLFEALTDLMQADFEKASKDYLDVYKSLTSVPGNNAEEQNRKAKFFRLLGQGRESQVNLVEAFQMYKEFGSLPIHQQGGIASQEDPGIKIPVNVWLRGRIAGMFAKAPPVQRVPLEAKIAEEWKVVDGKKNTDEIRSFVGMFDVPFQVGREARMRLADIIMERNERPNFLEAELLLHQVMGSEFRADAQAGGRALAALAQLEEKKGTVDSMRLAAAYYRELNRDFAKAAVRGAKTGSDLINELATDKRFLPFLEETSGSWGPVKIAARQLQRDPNYFQPASFVLQPEGDNTPFARQNRLLLDPSDSSNARVRLRDIATGQDRWNVNLGFVAMNQQIFFQMYQQQANNNNQGYHPNARHRFYKVKGHLIVCQIGVMVYCLDGDTGKKLWEMPTVEQVQPNGIVHLQQVMNDAEGNPEFMYWNQLTNQRFRVTLGRIGSAQASYVAVLSHKGLTVVDPLRGGVLWKKHDVPVNSHVFGDDQYLFVVEANDGGGVGVGRTLRGIDGEPVPLVPDFSAVYQGKIRVMGRQILAATPAGGAVSLRLYDIISGKDVWNQAFPAGSFVLPSEDPNFAGVVAPNGQLTVVDVTTGKALMSSPLVQGRITPQDIVGVAKDSFLLADGERFYVALNRPIDASKVYQGNLHNNFNNGTRCHVVNGWFAAFHRQNGERKIGDRVVTWKQGELAWHSNMPNQLVVLEQFEQSPVVVFSTRYIEVMPNGGNRWVSITQSLQKTNGKWLYDSGPAMNNSAPMFSTYQIDMKSRTVNLIGFGGTLQHFIDDGKSPSPVTTGPISNPKPGANTIAFDPNGLYQTDQFLNQFDGRNHVNKIHKAYEFPVEANRTYTIDMMSKQFDAYLFLLDDANRVVAQDDDGGVGLNSRIVFRAPRTGQYRIHATSLGGSSTGNFQLMVRRMP